jgi:iron complex transport system permease protein
LPLLLLLVPVLLVAYVLLGSTLVLTPADVVAVITGQDAPRLHEIAVNGRLPRGVFAILVGASLGAAGALLQALTRNPLASPDVTGVTAGAIAAAVATITFGPPMTAQQAALLVPVAGTAGGLAAAVLVYVLVRGHGSVESSRLLLVGILVGGILTSATSLSLLFLGSSAAKLYEWLSGTLLGITWGDVASAGVFLGLACLLLIRAIPAANALQLGDDVAVSLGQHRERDRLLVLFTAVVLTAGAISSVGAIGFVGLLGPHLVRRIVGSDLRRLAPAAALAGAVMVLTADLLARNIDPSAITGARAGDALQSGPLPVGVYLTLFGIPFLLSLLWRRAAR